MFTMNRMDQTKELQIEGHHLEVEEEPDKMDLHFQ